MVLFVRCITLRFEPMRLPRLQPFVVVLLALLFFSGSIDAQVQDSLAFAAGKRQSYVGSYWHNGIGLVKRPFEWKGEQWIKPAAAVLITGLSITIDEPIASLFDTDNNKTFSTFADVGDVMGGIPVQFGISALPIAAGGITGKKEWVNFGTDNLQAQFFSGGFAFLLKELTHRARPETGEGAYAWYGPFKGGDNKSFYSGHTTLAFATATMIYLHSQKKWWVAVIGYTLASGVGISRMAGQQHWLSDVVAGAAMGTAISYFVYQKQEKRRQHNKNLLKPIP